LKFIVTSDTSKELGKSNHDLYIMSSRLQLIESYVESYPK